MKPKLLILTGPQGSGNHMWSKIFALSSSVIGWDALLDTAWIGHDKEPYAPLWNNPELIHMTTWTDPLYVTSISCPYMLQGIPTVPNYTEFIKTAQQYLDVRICVLGRDINILAHQESRLRDEATYELMLERIGELMSLGCHVHFLSMELLQLYRESYLWSLSMELEFPIQYDSPELDNIIINANKPYIQAIESGAYDDEAIIASKA